MTTEEKGPFMQWVTRATQIAARAVKCLQSRNLLIEQVRKLRAEGKQDEVKALQTQFDATREQNRAVTTEADRFRQEFQTKFPDRGDQNAFVAGVRKNAVANLFTFRMGKGKDAEMLNVASQVMWVVAPWDRGTFAILRLRDRTGVNITEVTPESLKRLLRKTDEMLGKIADQLPSIDDVAEGAGDFATQQVVEDYDEISSDRAQVNSVLERIETSRKRHQDQRGQHGEHAGDDKKQQPVTDPIMKLSGEIEEKKKAMQQAASGPKPNFSRAAELQTEIETLDQKLETMRNEKAEADRMSGVAAMAGSAPETGVPIVKLSGLMVVVEETGEQRPIEEAIALYTQQVQEMTEAAEEHDARVTELETQADTLRGEKKRTEAAQIDLQAEAARSAAAQCRVNVAKLTETLEILQSDLTQYKADQANAAKKMVKDAAAGKKPVVEAAPPVEPAAAAVVVESMASAMDAVVATPTRKDFIAMVTGSDLLSENAKKELKRLALGGQLAEAHAAFVEATKLAEVVVEEPDELTAFVAEVEASAIDPEFKVMITDRAAEDLADARQMFTDVQ